MPKLSTHSSKSKKCAPLVHERQPQCSMVLDNSTSAAATLLDEDLELLYFRTIFSYLCSSNTLGLASHVILSRLF